MYKQIQEIVDRFNGKHFNGVLLQLENNTQKPEDAIKEALSDGYTQEQAQAIADNLGYLAVYIEFPVVEYSEYCDVSFSYTRLQQDLTAKFKEYVPEGTEFEIIIDGFSTEFIGPNYPESD